MPLTKMVPLDENNFSKSEKVDVIDKCIKKIAKGDKEAIASLYRLTKTPIYSFALSILKNANDAEDVLQEVYIKIYQSAINYNTEGKPLAWMITITKKLCYMELRRKKVETDICEIEDILPDKKRVSSEDKILLETILNTLSLEERQILTLNMIAGFKHREIAKMLDIPISTSLSKYNRAIKKIKSKFEKEVR